MSKKMTVICSGGLDSVTLAEMVAAEGNLARLVSFDYGQTHKRELGFAAAAARRLSVSHLTIDLSDLGRQLHGSALTDPTSVSIPDGHYAEETMRQTVVPNRNAIFLTVAFAIAAANSDDGVGIGVHAGDHFIYPDCRPEFVRAFREMQSCALEGFLAIELFAPFVNLTKAEIVRLGARLHVPFDQTWSCYKGGSIHCGRCGTCVERREAFQLARIEDPTVYADPDFWVEACKKMNQNAS